VGNSKFSSKRDPSSLALPQDALSIGVVSITAEDLTRYISHQRLDYYFSAKSYSCTMVDGLFTENMTNPVNTLRPSM